MISSFWELLIYTIVLAMILLSSLIILVDGFKSVAQTIADAITTTNYNLTDPTDVTDNITNIKDSD